MRLRPVIALLAVAVSVRAGAAAFDFKDALNGLLQTRRVTAAGQAEATGVWAIQLSRIEPAPGQPHAEAVQLAVLRGKRELAAFLGQTLSASDTAVQEDGRESFSSTVKVDINQFLRGMRVMEEVERDGKRYAVLFATQKTADLAERLRTAMAEAGDACTVKALGLSPEADAAVARGAALASAKASAVEQVVGTVVSSVAHAVDDRVLAKMQAASGGCIKEFRILSEGVSDGNVYRLEIIATVAKKELLDSYQAILAGMGGITFAVVCEQTLARQTLAGQFADWGCTVTDEPAGATYLIEAVATFEPVTHPADGRDGTRCHLTVSIVDAVSREQVLTAQNESRKAVSFTGDETRRRTLAVEAGLKEIHAHIHEKLDAMIGKMAVSGRTVTVWLENYSAARKDALDAFMRVIARIPGAGAPAVRIDTAQRLAVVTVAYNADINALRTFTLDLLGKESGGAIAPEDIALEANLWRLRW